MQRIDHPHLHIDGVCGPAGTLLGNLHSSCPVDGLTWQCGAILLPAREPCGHTYTIAWAELDAANVNHLEADPSECIHLPPCPACGGLTIFNHNDVEYGSDLPEHHTMRMIREHVCRRPAFANLRRHAASRMDGTHQGRDFSHLPEHERPAHHCPVDVAAELAAARNPAE